MNDTEPTGIRPAEQESPALKFGDGWKEILEAPDTFDYRIWLGELSDLTLEALAGGGVDKEAVDRAWQLAIEQVADVAIDPGDMQGMTQAQIVETALVTLQMNIESMGWEEDGVALTVPNMFSGEAATIDIRELL